MRRLLTIALTAGLLSAALLITAGATAAVNCGGGVTVKGGTACWKAKSIVKEFKSRRKMHVRDSTAAAAGREDAGSRSTASCRTSGSTGGPEALTTRNAGAGSTGALQ